jgi:rod shape-determining protein MreC
VSIDVLSRVKEVRAIFVLIPLLLAHLVLISFQIEDPSGTILFKRWVLFVGTPLFDLSSRTSRGLHEIWRNYVWLHGAREENVKLQAAVRDLSLRVQALAQTQEENTRLHRLLRVKDNLTFQGLAAHVVGRAPGYLSNVLYIDLGTSDGVRVDAPVLSQNGVVGRVIVSSPHYSQVQLITNADASVGVMVERSHSPGILRGSGDALLDLTYIGNTEPVNVGEPVVTSGLDGIFPKGLPVGRVVESKRGRSVFQSIRVEPSADMLRIEEVLILLGTSKRN